MLIKAEAAGAKITQKEMKLEASRAVRLAGGLLGKRVLLSFVKHT